ncbi:hypothetical protein CCACVL1_29193 [Corchorus capsularis]|uniref:Uncharacterized protein n=1 Tax=Corchorus capsularis TaxID=210143 RepID=A0A1R3G383_COCAP|nr:hypothetical protein CCACVL1_29193 [Corchorus capsularis]
MAIKRVTVDDENTNTSLLPENTVVDQQQDDVQDPKPPLTAEQFDALAKQVEILTIVFQQKDPPPKVPSKAKKSSKNPTRSHFPLPQMVMWLAELAERCFCNSLMGELAEKSFLCPGAHT